MISAKIVNCVSSDVLLELLHYYHIYYFVCIDMDYYAESSGIFSSKSYSLGPIVHSSTVECAARVL